MPAGAASRAESAGVVVRSHPCGDLATPEKDGGVGEDSAVSQVVRCGMRNECFFIFSISVRRLIFSISAARV